MKTISDGWTTPLLQTNGQGMSLRRLAEFESCGSPLTGEASVVVGAAEKHAMHKLTAILEAET